MAPETPQVERRGPGHSQALMRAKEPGPWLAKSAGVRAALKTAKEDY